MLRQGDKCVAAAVGHNLAAASMQETKARANKASQKKQRTSSSNLRPRRDQPWCSCKSAGALPATEDDEPDEDDRRRDVDNADKVCISCTPLVTEK